MGLTKYNLGQLLELTTEVNSELKFGPNDVRGMTITKEIIPTKANVKDTDLKKFLIVKPRDFIFNPRTHGKKIGFGFNNSEEIFLISWNNIAFRMKHEAEKLVLPEYLFLHFNRSEWDREACYRSWGSSTEVFSWNALCEMELELPSIGIQQKYVDVYNAMLANQQNYERGLDDLRIVCEGFLDKLRATLPHKRIGDYIELSDEKNEYNEFGVDDVRGVSNEKRFIVTKANMKDVDLRPYFIVKPNDFSYVTVTSRNGEKASIAFNDTKETYICSSSYVVFRCKDENELLPRYLRIYFERSEFNRYARFNSWGSARETFDYTEMEDVSIPIPDINVQNAIADIFESYANRREISERLKAQIKDICPILIKGSIEEARGTKEA